MGGVDWGQRSVADTLSFVSGETLTPPLRPPPRSRKRAPPQISERHGVVAGTGGGDRGRSFLCCPQGARQLPSPAPPFALLGPNQPPRAEPAAREWARVPRPAPRILVLAPRVCPPAVVRGGRRRGGVRHGPRAASCQATYADPRLNVTGSWAGAVASRMVLRAAPRPVPSCRRPGVGVVGDAQRPLTPPPCATPAFGRGEKHGGGSGLPYPGFRSRDPASD